MMVQKVLRIAGKQGVTLHEYKGLAKIFSLDEEELSTH